MEYLPTKFDRELGFRTYFVNTSGARGDLQLCAGGGATAAPAPSRGQVGSTGSSCPDTCVDTVSSLAEGFGGFGALPLPSVFAPHRLTPKLPHYWVKLAHW